MPTEDEIAIAAYYRYLERTTNPQNDEEIAVDDLDPSAAAVDDWIWAERELMTEGA